MDLYIVTEFGCNSGYNDMYPPTVTVFTNAEEAYAKFNAMKDEIIHMKEEYDIDYTKYEHNNQISYIQDGGVEGAKRPTGVSLTHVVQKGSP